MCFSKALERSRLCTRVAGCPLDILVLAGGSASHPMQVLLSASVCAIHLHAAPAPLVPVTLSHLATAAACPAPTPAPHAGAAAALLASMLAGLEAPRWGLHLPTVHALLDRVFAAYL
jgi:hypothetical protein